MVDKSYDKNSKEPFSHAENIPEDTLVGATRAVVFASDASIAEVDLYFAAEPTLAVTLKVERAIIYPFSIVKWNNKASTFVMLGLW